MAAEQANRRQAPARRIVNRQRHGRDVVDRLECGHTVTAPYTGWLRSRKCPKCATLEETDRG